jgi:AMP deaminase
MAATATTPRAGRRGGEPGSAQLQIRDDYQIMWHTVQQHQQAQDDKEASAVCTQLLEALALRQKYMQPVEREGAAGTRAAEDPLEAPPWDGKRFGHRMGEGVMRVWDPEAGESQPAFEQPPSLEEYTRDLTRLIQICADAPVNSFCHQRLQKLEARFSLHVMENGHHEVAEQRACPHRDFYNSRKVDTHVHLAAAMNQKHLLRFIKKKMRVSPYEVVAKSSDGKEMTLSQVFDELGIRPYDLNLDSLGMHADPSIFCRFDKFNLKYNPLGKSRLREIFLKSENPQLVTRALRSVFQRRKKGLPGPSEGSGRSYTTRSVASAAWKPAVAPVARPRPPQS